MRSATLVGTVLALALTAGPLAAANRSDAGFVFQGSPIPDPQIEGGADACPGAAIASLPFTDPGTTCDNTNTITNYDSVACELNLDFPYPGPNAIYQITLAAGNSVAFSADLTGSTGDLALFLLGTCGTGSSCIDTSEDAIGPGAGPEEITAATYPAGTYFLYIDSYYGAGNPANCGTYTLNVTGTVPVELMSFSID